MLFAIKKGLGTFQSGLLSSALFYCHNNRMPRNNSEYWPRYWHIVAKEKKNRKYNRYTLCVVRCAWNELPIEQKKGEYFAAFDHYTHLPRYCVCYSIFIDIEIQTNEKKKPNHSIAKCILNDYCSSVYCKSTVFSCTFPFICGVFFFAWLFGNLLYKLTCMNTKPATNNKKSGSHILDRCKQENTVSSKHQNT